VVLPTIVAMTSSAVHLRSTRIASARALLPSRAVPFTDPIAAGAELLDAYVVAVTCAIRFAVSARSR
jgi:hypothetical protein